MEEGTKINLTILYEQTSELSKLTRWKLQLWCLNEDLMDFYFGVLDYSNKGCSCSSFSVVKEKSITTEWEERDVVMVIIMGCAAIMVYCRVVLHS